MSDTDKILQAITHLSTAVEALAEGQNEIRNEQTTMLKEQKEIKATIVTMATKQDLKTVKEELQAQIEISRRESKTDHLHLLARVNEMKKILINHQRSIKTLHKHTGIQDPNKQ